MSNLSTIQIIKKGESLTVEFKSKIDSVFKIAKTITSFANTSGGVLLIGVDDNGQIIGVESELRELEKLENAVSHHIDQKLIVVLKSEIYDHKCVIRVEIKESEDKPHFAINEKNEKLIYIRVKDKSIPIPIMLLQGESNSETNKIITSRHVKSLITYLKEVDSIDAKGYCKMINVSEKRASRMLNDLFEKQILVKLNKSKLPKYSLKWIQ